ncbi:tyrosine-type recombinase/integrase [Pseudotabrizicola algicola]|uniref:Tyrosine-type recombinase/integrase n=1 Tax=Pseudotabrizicola algicola TaxID=2709381 RepID=A0A6B3RP54_9RHOB|nr:tyrosine-type recombinase/integrase [Pseudotabrizicola algicola]NEX46963.1 tyrosine-type recombinase/integrase [Pseudotabrizicola algicola]
MGKREVSFVHLHVYNDRHGKTRAYYKPQGGKGIALPLPVGSPEFLLAYAKAVEGEKLERARAKMPTCKDTFRDLLRLYLGSPLYMKLSPSSKRNYRIILEKFCAKYGNLPMSQFSRKHASAILGKLSDTPEAANTLMKRLRLLLGFAVQIGMIAANPMTKMESYAANEDGYHTWTEEEIAQFMARHPLGTKAHLALMLMLCTGQRKSDAVRMGWGDVANGMIRIRQQKTGTPLMIPILPELKAALADQPKDAPTFLRTEYGRPYSVAGFGNWMRDRCDEAGLPNCASHGLRKACARRLAEAGCTIHQIKAITGHKTDAEVHRYTAKADQVRLAHSAFEKLQDTANNPKPANPL